MTVLSKAGAALAVICGAAAGATTLLALDVPALTREADTVVRGSVTRVASRWTGDHRRIITEVELQVAKAYKGTSPETVTLVQPGGVVGEIGQAVSGVAPFAQGEEVVVFLERKPGETYLLVGMAQGKFTVERSSDGKVAYAVPAQAGDALLIDPATGKPREPGAPRTPPTLEALEAQIRGAAGEAPSTTVPRPPPAPLEKVP